MWLRTLRSISWSLIIVIALIPIYPQQASSAEVDSTPAEYALFESIPKVFSASRMQESIQEAPAAISVITAEDLRAWGIVDLPDAFRFIPGMDVQAFNGREWGVSARGMTERFSRRMLVLIDGMSVYTPLFSGVHWDQLPLLIEDIEKIEVIRGPNDTLYGFNAFNGVINITTKDPSVTHGWMGQYTYGSKKRDRFVMRYGDYVNLGDMGEADFRLSYSFNQSEGYGDRKGEELDDFRRLNSVTGSSRYTLNDKTNLEFRFGSKTGPYGQGPFTTGGATFERKDDFHYQLFRLNLKKNENHSGHLQFYHWWLHRDAKLLRVGLPDADTQERQIEFEAQYNFSLLAGVATGVLGAQYRNNTAEALQAGRIIEGNRAQKLHDDLYSVFYNQKIKLLRDKRLLNELSVVGGVRVEGSKFTGTDWAPRVSLMYSPAEDHFFRLTYSRAFRIPSFLENQQSVFVPANTGSVVRILGNQDLKRESVHSYEAGYSGAILNDRLTFDADAYIAKYSGLVNANQTQVASFFPVAQPSIFTFNNSAEASTYGLELESKFKLSREVEIFSNYTYENISDSFSNNVAQIVQDAAPRHKATVGVNIRLRENSIPQMPFLKDTSLNFLLHYRDAYNFYNSQDVPRSQFRIKKNIRFDLRVAKSFFDDGMELAFVAQNLIGGDHFESQFAEVPRLLYATVTFRGWPWQLGKPTHERDNGLIEKFQSS